MQGAIAAAKEARIDFIAFGDLFLEDVRAYREKMMASTGIGTLFPIWGMKTADLSRKIIDIGMKAVLTCIDPKKVDKSFAGRHFDMQLLNDLPSEVDPCGENGEFHTFVYEGPMFSKPLDVVVGEVVERDGFVFCDVLPVSDSQATGVTPGDQPVVTDGSTQNATAAAVGAEKSAKSQ
jgi:diphthamide synthase (EF-2-diphthine--ammonia ligase)